jgi:hypothetical protein
VPARKLPTLCKLTPMSGWHPCFGHPCFAPANHQPLAAQCLRRCRPRSSGDFLWVHRPHRMAAGTRQAHVNKVVCPHEAFSSLTQERKAMIGCKIVGMNGHETRPNRMHRFPHRCDAALSFIPYQTPGIDRRTTRFQSPSGNHIEANATVEQTKLTRAFILICCIFGS